MLSIRQSNAAKANAKLEEVKAEPSETNSAWLTRIGAKDGVLLIGGASLTHFRIRVAQSHARADLKPSSWSLAGILLNESNFLSVPLERPGAPGLHRSRGQVQRVGDLLLGQSDEKPQRDDGALIVRQLVHRGEQRLPRLCGQQ